MMPNPEPARASAAADEPQVRSWERFFKTYYREEINEAALEWPLKRSLSIDFFDLQNHDGNLAEFLLEHPYEALAHAAEALKSVDVPAEPRPRLQVRVAHLPVTHTPKIRDVRAELLGRLIALRGRVVRAKEVRPKVQDAVFLCQRCGVAIKVPQEEHLVLQEPLECYEDRGGCGRDSTFKILIGSSKQGQSVFVDHQDVTIEEIVGEVPDTPQRFHLAIEDDLAGHLQVGDIVTVTGILRCHTRKSPFKEKAKSTLFDRFLEVNGTDKPDDSTASTLTPEDRELVRKVALRPDAVKIFRDSLAPSIYGHEHVKHVLALQLFGGVRGIQLPDGTRLRGDIHVLLAGDPGVAKSQLLRRLAQISPRGRYVSGKGASGAGLTAAAMRDDGLNGDGRWVLEAGAMPRVDQGNLSVDELDKMGKDDQSNMHEAMEQQTVTIAKAGITATMQTRCSVTGAANPHMGRFDPDTSIHAQLAPARDYAGIPPALLSRFDIIYTMVDKPKREEDRKLVRHVLDARDLGTRIVQGEDVHDVVTIVPPVMHILRELLDEKAGLIKPDEFLRKWVMLAREDIHPRLDGEAQLALGDFFTDLRAEKTEEGRIPLTPRQFEALVRLTEAQARMRLSSRATKEDAHAAIGLFQIYMDNVFRNRDGKYDVDRAVAPYDATERAQAQEMQRVVSLVLELQIHHEDGAREDQLIEMWERRSGDRKLLLKWLGELCARNGSPVWSTVTGYYRARPQGRGR